MTGLTKEQYKEVIHIIDDKLSVHFKHVEEKLDSIILLMNQTYLSRDEVHTAIDVKINSNTEHCKERFYTRDEAARLWVAITGASIVAGSALGVRIFDFVRGLM